MDIEKILSKLHCMVYTTVGQRTEWKTKKISSTVKCLTGWTREEYLNNEINWLDLIHPKDRDRVLMEALIILEKDTEITQEYRIIDKFGNIKHVQDNKSSQTEGDIKVIIGVVKDISNYIVAVDKNKKLLNEFILKNHEMQKIINSYQVLNSLLPRDNELIIENLKYAIEEFFENAESSSLKKLSSPDREAIKVKLLNTINSASKKHTFKELSSRENEVAQLLALGKRQKEIAQELNISVETVKTHAKRIRQKLSSIKS